MMKTDKYVKSLWSPKADDSISKRRIVNGPTTNIMDLTKIKYKWAAESYKYQLENFWVPAKISLQQDILDYNCLSDLEKKVYCSVLSALSFLDGLQTQNLGNISEFITAPEIKAAIGAQTFMEIIHNMSYSQIINTILPLNDLEKSLYLWKKHPDLYARNKFLIKNLTLHKNSSNLDLLRQMVTNYALESLSFTAGFYFMYELKVMKGLMKGTTAMIRLIHRDELSHCNLFRDLILNFIKEENLSHQLKNILDSVIPTLVTLEKTWISTILGSEKFSTLNKTNLGDHVDYLATLLYFNLGYEYNIIKLETPLKYLQFATDLEETATLRSSFFDRVNTSYNLATALEGLEDDLI